MRTFFIMTELVSLARFPIARYNKGNIFVEVLMALSFCPLFSGSSGNAIYVGAGETRLLVDAGMPGRSIASALTQIGVPPESLSAILITHEHSDHVKGAGILSRRFDLPVYANEGTWMAMEEKLGEVALRNRRVFTTGEDFFVQEIDVQSFAIPHDAREPVGYALYHKGCKVAVATDLGHIQSGWMDAVRGAQVLMLEANHDVDMLMGGSYPQYLKRRISGQKGHLCNNDTGKALIRLVESGVQNCILGHLSKENNLPELAYQTVAQALTDEGIALGRDVRLDLAHRDHPGMMYTLG